MDDDQQFCLRWNNHQSTLISVFDTLLENETLVDCTLAAEGKFLKAHKVVLSACSPYFATLLQEQYDKHPIFILKDVKYQELRAMMDYMYRGEVNISQDQLAALLKAAESLQIKGLSDNRTSGNSNTSKQDHHRGLNAGGAGISGGGIKLSGSYTLEQTKRARMGPSSMESQDMSASREGSSSPSRRRRKVRRRSIETGDNSNSSQIQVNQPSLIQQQQSNANLVGVSAITAAASALASQIPASAAPLSAGVPAASASAAATISSTQGTTQQQLLTTSVTKKTESAKATTSDAMNTEKLQAGGADEHDMEQIKSEKQNHKQKTTGVAKETTEMVIEPKSEYDDDGNDETVEDLTLDEEEMGMDDLDHNAGTSQGGEGSSQGYAAWQHDRSQDDILLATQEAQQRDPQDLDETKTDLHISEFLTTDFKEQSEKFDIKTEEYSDDNENSEQDPDVTIHSLTTSIDEPSSSFSTLAANSTMNATNPAAITCNPKAIVALQQLASISSVQSFKRIVPNLPKGLINESLLSDNQTSQRIHRPKRLSQYESNRCPLCSRNYRSQAFLNEHMRKEHSVLI